MFNLCLPMRVINISQRSGSSYSHPNGALDLAGNDKGIDFAFALGDCWKCIAGPFGSNTYFFTACDQNGNPIPVHCADQVNRIVTVAMTHARFDFVERPQVGRIYKNNDPMYEEGTYSVDPDVKITGNHIHYEVAGGLQTTKYFDKSMGVYRMANELKPEDVCFICDSFSRVASLGGAQFHHCTNIDYVDPLAPKFEDGLQKVKYQDQDIHVYKLSAKEKIGLVACKYGEVIDITKFKLPGKKINAIMNASYFMRGTTDEYLGRVQGFLNDSNQIVDARPPSPEEKGQKADKPYMDLVITKDGNITFGDFNSWDYPIQEVTLGVSPAGIEIAGGISINKYSPAVGYPKITNRNTQSMLLRCPDGRFAFGAVTGALAPIPDLRTWGLIYNLDHLSVYDSGGSTQLVVNGEKVVYTGRKIPVVFIAYEDETDPEPIPVTEPIGVIHCELSGLNIRTAIRGEILTTVKRGEVCKLLGFVDGIQSDGYQWVFADHNGIKGYAQLDTSVLWIEEEGEKT